MKLVVLDTHIYYICFQMCSSITTSVAELVAMQDETLRTHFPISVFQTGAPNTLNRPRKMTPRCRSDVQCVRPVLACCTAGSATSSNMNMNEVLARLASARLGRTVHANDHVNMSQVRCSGAGVADAFGSDKWFCLFCLCLFCLCRSRPMT